MFVIKMVNVLNAILGTIVFLAISAVITFIVYIMFKFAAKEEGESAEGN